MKWNLSAARSPAFAAALSAAVSLVACGSGSSGSTTPDSGTASDAGSATDAGSTADAGNDGGADAGGCTASAAYGVVVVDAGDQTANYTPGSADGGLDGGGTSDEYRYQANLNADVDYIDMELYAGFGAFANGIETGTYTLAGDELNYSTCGLCVLIFTNYNGVEAVDTYMATGGTVTLTSLYPTLAGSFANVTFQHVTIDQTSYVSTPVNDGCDSTLTALDFSADDSNSSRHLLRKRR